MEAEDRETRATKPTTQGKLADLLKRATADAAAGSLTARRAAGYLLEIRKIGDPDFKEVTVRDQVNGWVKQQAKRVGESTADGYEEMEAAVSVALGDTYNKPLDRLTHGQCEDLLHALKADGIRIAATANQHFRAFRRALQGAVKARLIADNPAEGVAPLPETDSTERAPFTAAEVSSMLTHEGTSDEWRGMILFGGNTGLRMGDIAKLTSSAVESGHLVLRPSKTKRRGKAAIVRVPLSKSVKAWLGARDGVLFPKLGKFSSANLSYHFKQIMKRAGVPDEVMVAGTPASRSFHCLRHSFTTWLAEAEIHPDVRKKLTGHSTEDAHALYTHHDKALKKAIDSLPDL